MADKTSKPQKLGDIFNRQRSFVQQPTSPDSSVEESEHLIDSYFPPAQPNPELNLGRLRSGSSYESFPYTNSVSSYEASTLPNMTNNGQQDHGLPLAVQPPIPPIRVIPAMSV